MGSRRSAETSAATERPTLCEKRKGWATQDRDSSRWDMSARGDAEFDPRQEIEVEGGKAQRLFVFLVEKIVEAAINFHAGRESVGEAYIRQDVALVAEQT